MRGNDQHFNVGINHPIEDVVWKAWHGVLANGGWEFDTIPIRGFANFPHRIIKGGKVASAKSYLARLVIGHMLKVLNASGFVKKVTHLSSAFACCRTSSAETRLDKP